MAGERGHLRRGAGDGQAPRALASNLLGALLGGLLEYTPMGAGLRHLVVVAGLFCTLALLSSLRRAVSAGRAGTPAPTG